MSKKIQEKPETPLKPNNNKPISDSFSFLEFDQFLAQGNNYKKETKERVIKKKVSNDKKDLEKKYKLDIKPNPNIARDQTLDDLMYIENEYNLLREKTDKEEKKEEKKEEQKEENKEEKKNEKNIQKKFIDKKKTEKIDKNIIQLPIKEEKPKKKEQSESKDKKKKEYEPEKYKIESIINKIKDKNPQAYTPIVLPFEKDDNKEKTLKDELTENNENDNNKLFIFQFPRQIPIKGLKEQIKSKEEENDFEEPNYDKNGFLITPEFKNIFREIPNNAVIGKLVIMKSGKIKIKMGDIYFDINQGSQTKFAQYPAIITKNEENEAYILRQPLNKKLIVTPEFD